MSSLDFRHVQVAKKRDAKGNIIEVEEQIVYATPESIAAYYAAAKRSKHLNPYEISRVASTFKLQT